MTAVLEMICGFDTKSTNKQVGLQQTKRFCIAKENFKIKKPKYIMGENICKSYI